MQVLGGFHDNREVAALYYVFTFFQLFYTSEVVLRHGHFIMCTKITFSLLHILLLVNKQFLCNLCSTSYYWHIEMESGFLGKR